MSAEITKLLLRVAEEQNPTLPQVVEIARGAEAPLYGPGGPLDSLGLVRFIVEIEAAVEGQFGCAVALANERALSQKHSPFLTVGTLAAYLEEVLKEAAAQPSD